MAKVISEDIGEFYQHSPSLAVIVTASARGKNNAMAAAWHTPISFKPPLYGVCISTKRFTYKLIIDSQEFGVNFLPFEKADMVAKVGGSKGADVDKFLKFKILKDKLAKTPVPILKAAYECRLIDDREYGDHRFIVGEIVAVHYNQEIFTPEGVPDLDKVSPTLYLGHDTYVTTLANSRKILDREAYGKV